MAQKRHDADLRYIYRQQHPTKKILGWQVLYSRGLPRKIYCYFGDNAYGGTEPALAAAKEFRDLLLAKYAPPEPLVPPKAQRKLRVPNKPTELIGMRIARVDPKREGDLPSYTWTGYARVNGKLINRGWAIHKWGYEPAFWNAANHRHSLTGQPLPETVPEPPDYLKQWAQLMKAQGIDIFAKK